MTKDMKVQNGFLNLSRSFTIQFFWFKCTNRKFPHSIHLNIQTEKLYFPYLWIQKFHCLEVIIKILKSSVYIFNTFDMYIQIETSKKRNF